jgi:hypothetical protein
MTLIVDVLQADTFKNEAGGSTFPIIKQIVTGTTTTQVDLSSSTLTDTGLTATIVPTSASSKILVLVSQSVAHNGRSIGRLVIFKGASNIYDTIDVGDADNQRSLHFATILDAPSTTSSTVYKTQMSRFDQSGTINVQRNDSGSAGKSMIILIEVAA